MEENRVHDIHERIYQFVLQVISLTAIPHKNMQNSILINQIIRSVTSVGANDQEADGAASKRDFVAKYAIVRKETKETVYWLRLLGDTNISIKEKSLKLQKEGLEIARIISTIIHKTRSGIKD